MCYLLRKLDLLLAYAKVGILEDDKESWPDYGNLDIEGFVYNGISEKELTYEDRIEWIHRQYIDFNKSFFSIKDLKKLT